MNFITHHPLRFISAFTRTLTLSGPDYLHQTIGVLGWLDTFLPSSFHRIARGSLLLGFLLVIPVTVITASHGQSCRYARQAFIRATLAALACLASAICIFIALYLTWTPVGSPIIGGVQGRYFLPLLMMLPLVPVIALQPDNGIQSPPSGPATFRLMALQGGVRICLILFMIFSLATTYNALVSRYW